jgi:hypothetical protein
VLPCSGAQAFLQEHRSIKKAVKKQPKNNLLQYNKLRFLIMGASEHQSTRAVEHESFELRKCLEMADQWLLLTLD